MRGGEGKGRYRRGNGDAIPPPLDEPAPKHHLKIRSKMNKPGIGFGMEKCLWKV
jgi:hypothetical protein